MPGEKELKALCSLIETVDTLRAGFFVSWHRLGEKISATKMKEVQEVGKTLKRVHTKVIAAIKSDPKVVRLAKTAVALRQVARMAASIFVILILYVLWFPDSPLSKAVVSAFQNRVILGVVVGLVVVALPFSYAYADYKARRAIAELRLKKKTRGSEKLKEIVNQLIEILSKEAEKKGVKKEKLKLNLYLPDYKGVKILKKPGRIRSTYLAVPA